MQYDSNRPKRKGEEKKGDEKKRAVHLAVVVHVPRRQRVRGELSND